jgi:hypothetical protein
MGFSVRERSQQRLRPKGLALTGSIIIGGSILLYYLRHLSPLVPLQVPRPSRLTDFSHLHAGFLTRTTLSFLIKLIPVRLGRYSI